MYFVGAIYVITCAIPLACATVFVRIYLPSSSLANPNTIKPKQKNASPGYPSIQDSSGNITNHLPPLQSIVINGGWALVWLNDAEGYDCNAFIYRWPENYIDVAWTLNLNTLTASLNLTDESTY
jgi:hypothetical protein